MDARDDLTSAEAARLIVALDRLQRRCTAVAFPLAVVRRYRDDGGGRLAALVGYYTFFAIFPLLLAFVTVFGFFLEGDPDLRRDVVDSALGQFPVIGDTLRENDGLKGSLTGLIIGLAVAVWAGLAALVAAAHAFNEVWAVPLDSRHRFLESRLRALIGLGGLSVGLIATIAINAVAALVPSSALARLGLWAGGWAVAVALALVGYELLTARPLAWRQHLPGAVFAGTGLFVLQLVGAVLLDRVVTNASTTYGTFALVIGGLTWFNLISQMLVLGAEINVVSEHHLWPRGIRRRYVTEADVRARDLERLSRTPAHLR